MFVATSEPTSSLFLLFTTKRQVVPSPKSPTLTLDFVNQSRKRQPCCEKKVCRTFLFACAKNCARWQRKKLQCAPPVKHQLFSAVRLPGVVRVVEALSPQIYVLRGRKSATTISQALVGPNTTTAARSCFSPRSTPAAACCLFLGPIYRLRALDSAFSVTSHSFSAASLCQTVISPATPPPPRLPRHFATCD